MFSLFNPNKIYVKNYSTEDGVPAGALLSFNGKIKDALIERFKKNYSLEGDHIKNGGALSPTTMLSLISGGSGALGLSGAASGSLFMATANPATLMAIGNGVGSAVMGVGGIVAHAPFVAVTGALMPVVAPLIVFQVISTILILNQFDSVNKKLDEIKKGVERVIQRAEATFIGEILSASRRIDEMENRFSICNQFTSDMVIRLALIEDKINPIFERYQFLYQSQKIDKRTTSEDLQFKQNDAYLAIILSILDLRIDILRVRLAVQENVGYMRNSTDNLISKVEHYKTLWKSISNGDDKLIEDVAEQLSDAIEHMSWWQKTMPNYLGGERKVRVETEKKVRSFTSKAKAIRRDEDFNEQISIAQTIGEQLLLNVKTPKPMNLVYWRDEHGEHSYYTDDLQLINNAKVQ